MPGKPTQPRFDGLRAASPRASAAASGASRKRDTRCELLLRAALRQLRLRYHVGPKDLPGRPDIVFRGRQVAVFCDGDFWHGRDLGQRLEKLSGGNNPTYWLAKITRNVERDREHDAALRSLGWVVLRFWETDIKRDPAAVARTIEAIVRSRPLGAARNNRLRKRSARP